MKNSQNDTSGYSGGQVMECLRCGSKMRYLGNFNFHEGTRMGALGDLFELFVNKESFDIVVCPRCGKAEFFIPQ